MLYSLLLIVSWGVRGQQYTGMTGLIHVPSAEMNAAGMAMAGVHFMHKEMVPDGLKIDGEKYNTSSHYLSLTPFSWIELGYTCTLVKVRKDGEPDGKIGFYSKDRYVSAKLNPLREGKWWPAVAVGINDPAHERRKGNNYFANYYVAASKHLLCKGGTFGVHLAYRNYKREYNEKWDGVVGGVTFRPVFVPQVRVIAEYDGNTVNAGIDCLLWKRLFIQGSLQNGKYFSGGICYRVNLL